METATIVAIAMAVSFYLGISILDYILIKRFITMGHYEFWTCGERITTIFFSLFGPITLPMILACMASDWVNRNWNGPAKW